MISRQRAWQIKQNELGNCEKCGKPAFKDGSMCKRCGIKNRLDTRSRRGHKAKRKGYPGRNIKYK